MDVPNINDTRSALEQAFITGWADRTPISFDNVDFDDSKVDEYVDLRFVMFGSTNMAIGSVETKALRHSGTIAVVIYIRLGTGSGKAWSYADQASDIMQNKYHGTTLFTTASEVRRNGDEKDGWFSVICSTPFSSDDC